MKEDSSILQTLNIISCAVTRTLCDDSRHGGPRCYQLENGKTQSCNSQCAAGCTGPSPSNCNVSMINGRNFQKMP